MIEWILGWLTFERHIFIKCVISLVAGTIGIVGLTIIVIMERYQAKKKSDKGKSDESDS